MCSSDLGSYRGEYKVVDGKGKELKGVKIAYDEANKKYTITITDKTLLGQKLEVKHIDAVSERAEKYIKQYGSKYNRYVWEHATKSGHTCRTRYERYQHRQDVRQQRS